MKPDTYDTIIDTTKELCSYSGWFLLVVFIIGFVLAIVYIIFDQALGFDVSIMYLTIADLVISSLIISFAFMIRKAKVRFGVERWRDFWMAFAHPIEISISDDNKSTEEMKQELKRWLDENTPRLYRITTRDNRFRDEKIKIVFRHRTDAVACKLKWG